MPATTPTTSSTQLDATQSSGPETWVLSSTVVSSTPANDPAEATQVEADGLRSAPRSTPLIIQVPADGPTTQPATAPTIPSSPSITGATDSADTTASTANASSPTCSALKPQRPRPGRISVPPGDVGSSGGQGNPFLETACKN